MPDMEAVDETESQKLQLMKRAEDDNTGPADEFGVLLNGSVVEEKGALRKSLTKIKLKKPVTAF